MDFLRLVRQTTRFSNVNTPTPPAPPSVAALEAGAERRRKRNKKKRKRAAVTINEERNGISLFKQTEEIHSDRDEEKEREKSQKEDEMKRRRMREENIAALRRRTGIRVVGSDKVAPVTAFQELQTRYEVPQYLLDNLNKCGWENPTPIQMQAMPVLLSGRELLASAPTGSGKTAAFVLPILAKLKSPGSVGFRAIVLSPARELAQQIYRQFLLLSKGCAFRTFLLNASNADMLASSKRRDILVSTPYRLKKLIEEKQIDLSTVEMLIFDEGDQLFEDGFLEIADEVLHACSNSNIQRALFSATMPEGVESLARSVLQNPLRVSVGLHNTTTMLVSQRLQYCGSESGKLIHLRDLFRSGVCPPALVFVQSKSRARQLFHELRYDKLRVDFIDSDQTSTRRDQAVSNFRSGKTWMLICTELMARGIDFKDVNCVVNYDLPTSTTSYIHRVGRTGRAGRAGTAVSLFTDEDAPFVRSIAGIMRRSGCEVPQWILALHKPGRSRTKMLKTRPLKRKRINERSA